MSTPSVTVEICGGVGEIKCDPNSHVPSDALLERLIADCRTESNRCFNVFLNVPAQRRSEFEQKGWQVSGLIANHFGLGDHALRMRFPIANSRDGRADGLQLRNYETILKEVNDGLPGYRSAS